MKIASTTIVGVLTFLAISSGITKVMLVQRDVDFFGAYGFTSPILMTFGFMQIVGGVLLVSRKTRAAGAAVVAITFLISLYLLVMDGNVPASIMTVVATTLLAVITRQNWGRDR